MKKIKYFILTAVLMSGQVALAQWNVSGAHSQAGLPSGSITNIVTGVMNWLLILVGLFGVIGFAVSGILYLISSGDEGKMQTAKNAMVWSIIGVIVALLGYVIIQAVNSMLNANPGF